MARIAVALLLTAALFGSVSGARADGMRSFVFDGARFGEGEGEGAILVRNGLLPVVAGVGKREDPLPSGTGALALLCYLHSSGGKLKRHPRVVPITGAAVSVEGEGITLASRTDSAGYLILALPPGSYRVRLFGFVKTVAVERGKTTLASLGGGKRMVD